MPGRKRGLSPEDIGTWTGILDQALRSSMDAFELSREGRAQFEEEHWKGFVLEGLAKFEALRGLCQECEAQPAYGVGCQWVANPDGSDVPTPELLFLCRSCREAWGA